jgi:hypothetical protein
MSSIIVVNEISKAYKLLEKQLYILNASDDCKEKIKKSLKLG